MDLIVRRAQLTDRPSGQHLDIGIDGGRIVAIEPNLAAEGATFDAAARSVGSSACSLKARLEPTGRFRTTPGAAIVTAMTSGSSLCFATPW